MAVNAEPPRLLAIMGSGETSPTMVKAHRGLLARLGPPPVPAVVLDTPFGFQANADDLTARAVRYFRESVGHDLEVASLRGAGGEPDPLAEETMLARLRRARYVFAGPGSPSYALRYWRRSPFTQAVADKLRAGGPGGCLTFASAAALTLGVATVPVYEIYKVGEEPRWLEGLDLLAAAGLRAAVIPHFDNTEGGTHDTRYCYLGEARLAILEQQLPDDAFVLGVDEHTVVVLDLVAGTASVGGLGGVTVRRQGRWALLPSGSTVPIEQLTAMAFGPEAGSGAVVAGQPGATSVEGATGVGGAASPEGRTGVAGEAERPAGSLVEVVERSTAAFEAALEGRDAAGAVREMLELDEGFMAWSGDTLQSDAADRARAALRSMMVRLGEVAEGGADRVDTVRPFVEALLDQRSAARAEGRFGDADAIRESLVALGVEVNDTPGGTTWRLVS